MIRIVGNDIPGEKKMIVGLTQIRGVGYMFANTILNVLKINPNQRIGYLSSEQIKSIENVIKIHQRLIFHLVFKQKKRC